MFREGIKHPVRGRDASDRGAAENLTAIKTLTLAGYSQQSPTHANANLRLRVQRSAPVLGRSRFERGRDLVKLPRICCRGRQHSVRSARKLAFRPDTETVA